MIRALVVSGSLLCLAVPAWADPCDDLVNALELAISEPGIGESEQGSLKGMMSTARDSQSKGDLGACETALQALVQSPLPNLEGPGGGCEKNKEHSV